MRKWKWFGLAIGMTSALAVILVLGDGKVPAQSDLVKKANSGKRVKEFLAAFDRGDAKAVSEFWTPTGDYIDQDGHKTKGRAALEKLYAKVFAQQKGAKLNIMITSARLVTPDVGIEEGLTEVWPANDNPPSVAKFSAVLVKKEGEWYFESVHESIAQPPSNSEHFADLEWLLGGWTGESDKGESATASYAWAENRNFIVSNFATTLNGFPVVGGTQWIGWDAVDKQIRSWSFYSGGGIGEAVWTGEGGKWALKTTAKTSKGNVITATNLVTRLDADHAIWQMTQLTVDGKKMPDANPVKLKRVK